MDLTCSHKEYDPTCEFCKEGRQVGKPKCNYCNGLGYYRRYVKSTGKWKKYKCQECKAKTGER